MPSKTRTIASFTSIVVMELLATVPSVQTSTVNRILPFVLHSFEGGITEDYRVCVCGAGNHFYFSQPYGVCSFVYIFNSSISHVFSSSLAGVHFLVASIVIEFCHSHLCLIFVTLAVLRSCISSNSSCKILCVFLMFSLSFHSSTFVFLSNIFSGYIDTFWVYFGLQCPHICCLIFTH